MAARDPGQPEIHPCLGRGRHDPMGQSLRHALPRDLNHPCPPYHASDPGRASKTHTRLNFGAAIGGPYSGASFREYLQSEIKRTARNSAAHFGQYFRRRRFWQEYSLYGKRFLGVHHMLCVPAKSMVLFELVSLCSFVVHGPWLGRGFQGLPVGAERHEPNWEVA